MKHSYPAYKPTHIPWLPSVPEHWEVRKLKFLLNELNIRSTTGAEELLSLSKYKGVVPKKTLEERAGGALSLIGYKKVFKNNLVINKMQAVNGLIDVSNLNGITSPDYSVYETKENSKSDIKYLNLLLNQIEYLTEFKKRATGVMEGFIRLYTDDLFDIQVLLPPLSEQGTIADFLDTKTRQIEQAIAKKERLIDLLKERKQIIIQDAVTKGVPGVSDKSGMRSLSGVETKDSGVEWIGRIPDHWEVRKLKFVVNKIGSGITPRGGADNYLKEGVPLLRSQNIHFGKINLNDVAYISQKTHDEMSNSKVRFGDVLLNITGGSLGRCHYVDFNSELNVNQHVCIVRPKNIIATKFLNYILSSETGQIQIWNNQQGGGREGLNFKALGEFDIPYVQISEQHQIITYIERQSEKIDKAIQLQTEQIGKLKEYKTVLINEVVTGQRRLDSV